jgi:hypothetical protein
MSYLSIRANLLVLRGNKRTLRLAELHNTRNGYPRFDVTGRTQYHHRHKNLELIALDGEGLQERVFRLLSERGIDPTSKALKAKNRGFAVEFLITVTAGHQCCFDVLYAEILHALMKQMPECPIAHAVVHYDEGNPHLHIIAVPIVERKLQADKVRGYISVNTERKRAIYDLIDAWRYGLTYPEKLKGAMKELAAHKCLAALKSVPDQEIGPLLRQEIESAIHARPEPFASKLGISFGDLYENFSRPPSDAIHESLADSSHSSY